MSGKAQAMLLAGVIVGAGVLYAALSGLSEKGKAADAQTPGAPPPAAARYRPAAVAGAFYPAIPDVLSKQVEQFLEAEKPAIGEGTRVIAVISPHAGYAYSGPTAGKTFAYLSGATPTRVVVIGLSHGGGPVPVWVDDVEFYRTPLGDVPVDREAAAKLKAAGLPLIAGAAPNEHSIEVELPFLHEVLAGQWRLVPILVAQAGPEECKAAAQAIRGILDDSTIVCVSSDFTHYGRAYGYVPFTGSDEEIRKKLAELDEGALKEIVKKDASGFDDYCRRTGITICGKYPIMVLLELLPEWAEVRQAAYAMSGDKTGDFSVSVDYEGIVFTVEGRAGDLWGTKPQGGKAMGKGDLLTDSEKSTLLKLARASLEAAICKGREPDLAGFQLTEALKEKRGAFVTLQEKGELRGCIGYVEARMPLWQTVMENAVNAAVHDPRFPTVTAAEVPKIKIEISAMSPLERTTDVSKIEVGKHGIMLSRGMYRGLLLPQVATEYGWNREEFLQHTCLKAGLPSDAWKDPATKIEIFSAEVFHEEGYSE